MTNLTCRFVAGDKVLLQQPGRHQKCLAPFESGWNVKQVVSPSTVVMERTDRAGGKKTVNVCLLKLDPGMAIRHEPQPEVRAFTNNADEPGASDCVDENGYELSWPATTEDAADDNNGAAQGG